MSDSNPAEVRIQVGRKLAHGMLDAVGLAIVTGRHDQSTFPTEAELAKQHGVSRSVTREAVKMLTAKGLLCARPRQGTIVQSNSSRSLFDTDVRRWLLNRKFSVELLKQFNQLRVAIAPEAAELAAAFADAKEREAINAGLDACSRRKTARTTRWKQTLPSTFAPDTSMPPNLLRHR